MITHGGRVFCKVECFVNGTLRIKHFLEAQDLHTLKGQEFIFSLLALRTSMIPLSTSAKERNLFPLTFIPFQISLLLAWDSSEWSCGSCSLRVSQSTSDASITAETGLVRAGKMTTVGAGSGVLSARTLRGQPHPPGILQYQPPLVP